MRKLSKYRAAPTVIDGVRFASKKEAARYAELKLLERAGEIHDLRLQPRFVLSAGVPDAIKIGEYRGDFQYCQCETPMDCRGTFVVEDVKSIATKTRIYKWKVKHLRAEYGIEVQEV